MQGPNGAARMAAPLHFGTPLPPHWRNPHGAAAQLWHTPSHVAWPQKDCLLYTSDAADDTPCVDL
eukprot:2048114-Pyramimonas_sp.AAC.1